LLAATDLLKEGLFWRIGNGKDVKICGSKWIPKPSSFSVQSPYSQFECDEKVAAPIEPQRREWKTQVIQSIFKKDEAELICNIPLSKNSQPNKLVWRATSSGIFTVKSAYYLEKERIRRENGECFGGKGWEVFLEADLGSQNSKLHKSFLVESMQPPFTHQGKLTAEGNGPRGKLRHM
jgi:hypothetical protein